MIKQITILFTAGIIALGSVTGSMLYIHNLKVDYAVALSRVDALRREVAMYQHAFAVRDAGLPDSQTCLKWAAQNEQDYEYKIEMMHKAMQGK
jgi:hypothetical protein